MRAADSGMSGVRTTDSPLQSVRIDKSVLSTVSLSQADADDKAYWASQSPTARLQALELMRQVAYGYDPATARLERVLEVAQRIPR